MTLLDEVAHLADVPVSLEMELDRKVMPIEEILGWQPGSVVWLTRSAGEAIDIYAGGALVGFGEVVIIETTFGIRITDFTQEV
jgi:flagellar motor switch protein FliN/FliY